MHSILALPNQKPLDSRASHQIFNLAFTKTISSAKSIHQRTSSRIELVSSSITSAKRYGLNADPYP